MSRLLRGRVAAAVPAALVMPILAAALARAADDFVQEDTPPVAAPQPRVLMMPPLRLEMRQLQRQAAEALPAETRKAAYLGVATRPLAPELRAQTDLPAGVGLLIDAVAADSPAARGGLERFDVLHKFDDQLVCNAEQLTALVEAAGKDKEVVVMLLRGGRQRVVTVTLGEREVAAAAAGVGPRLGFEAFGGLDGEAGLPFDLGELLGGALAEGLPGLGGDVQAQVLQIHPGGGRSQSVTVMSDGDGSVEIRETDGKRTVTIKDPAGQEVYSGPLADAADREQVPEAFRDKVRSAEERLGGRRQPSQKPAAKKPAAEAEAEAEADEI